MKQLCFAVFFLSTLAYAGQENYSGKDKEVMQPAPPPCGPYGEHEWNIGIWGTYVFTDNEEFDFNRNNFDRYLGSDDAWGGGIDLKYFFHRYYAVGIEAFGLGVERKAPRTAIIVGENGQPFLPQDEDKGIGAVLGTLTFRYPVGCSRMAPYFFVGGGAIFGGGDVQSFELVGEGNGQDYVEAYRGGNATEMIGQFGGGLECRITHHIGITADFSWNVIDGPQNNFGMVRAGVNFAF
jgi:hypothetical protein